MSGEVNAISKTQIIVVEPTSSKVSIVDAGPSGISGEAGSSIHVGPTPPSSPGLHSLWVDTSSADGTIFVWNGATWDEEIVKIWDGSAWVEKPLKVWDGSAWILA